MGRGVDAGFTLAPNTLRAPDVAVAARPSKRGGWISGMPPLAVEYAAQGQNEADLQVKIKDLLAAGTLYVWGVRLTDPHRVEVHAAGKGIPAGRGLQPRPERLYSKPGL